GSLAVHPRASGNQDSAQVALLRPPRPPRTSRLLAGRGRSRRVAPDRVARWSERADEVLSVDPAGRHAAANPRASREAALADRARLRRAEGRARPGPLRRSRMEGLPPPRLLVHSRVRLPGREAGSFSPLGPFAPRTPVPDRSRTRRLPS